MTKGFSFQSRGRGSMDNGKRLAFMGGASKPTLRGGDD